MASTIKLKNGSGAPTTGDLVQGEPALDLTNKRLYTENASGVVIEVGTNPGEDVTFADNRKAVFGAGSDLQIYHSGTNSFIQEQGTGDLYITTNGSKIDMMTNGLSEYGVRIFQDGEVSLYHNGSAKLTTTSTGIDVTGTVTADGLTVDSNRIDLNLLSTSGGIDFNYNGGSSSVDVEGSFAQAISVKLDKNDLSQFGYFEIVDGSAERNLLRVEDNGDISFYEDTGTTAKFFWDASAEKLSVGGSTIAGTLNLPSTGTITWDSTSCAIEGNASGADYIKFTTNASEGMRLDSSGNVLVGKTSADSGTSNGLQVASNGNTYITRTSATANVNTVLTLDRKSSDGEILRLNKDGTTVGSIGTNAGSLSIGTGDTGIRFRAVYDDILPVDMSTNTARDAAIDLGDSAFRFKDLYRSGSTISTSDQTMKQDIRELTEAEYRVAVACKPLLKSFRFIQEVETQGESAPIRFGIIAQELENAFTAEGLNADDYAMFRRDTVTDENNVETQRLGVCYENLLAFIIAAI